MFPYDKQGQFSSSYFSQLSNLVLVKSCSILIYVSYLNVYLLIVLIDRGIENFNYISLDVQEGWKYICVISLCKRLVNQSNADFSKYVLCNLSILVKTGKIKSIDK